jgi:hypothetical protein
MSALDELLACDAYVGDILVEEYHNGREHYRSKHELPWLNFTGDWTPLGAWAVGTLVNQWAEHYGFDGDGQVPTIGTEPIDIGSMTGIYEDEGELEMAGHVDRHNAVAFAMALLEWSLAKEGGKP